MWSSPMRTRRVWAAPVATGAAASVSAATASAALRRVTWSLPLSNNHHFRALRRRVAVLPGAGHGETVPFTESRPAVGFTLSGMTDVATRTPDELRALSRLTFDELGSAT